MGTTTLPNYIALFDDVLSGYLCDQLVDHFQTSDQEDWDRDGAPKFTQVNINKSAPHMVDLLAKHTLQTVSEYIRRCAATHLPPPRALEEFRVKRYNSRSDDRYDTHVDVASPESSSRYLALLYYLNDDFTGGETQFYDGAIIKPKRGTVLVFPPYWMYPHAGLRVLSGTKYIMSTYLHLR